MKKQILIFLSLTSLILFSTSCMKKDLDDNNNTTTASSIEDLKIPQDFDWSTTQKIDVNIGLDVSQEYKGYQKVSLYLGDPANAGSLILSGSFSKDKNYTTTVEIPSYIKEVYLVRSNAAGGKETVAVAIANAKVEHVFTDLKATAQFKEIADGPGCTDGCDVVVTGNDNYTISGGQTYCVPASFTGKITWQAWSGGGTLIICGTANITQSTTLGTDCHIIVAEGGTLIMGNSNNPNKDIKLDYGDASLTIYETATVNARKLIMNGSSTSFINYSDDVSFTGDYENNGFFTNHGTIDFGGEVTNNESFTNYGILNIDDHMEINDYFVNSGKIYVDKKIYFNANATCQNNCIITAGDHVEINNDNFEMNSAYLYTTKKLEVWANITLNDASQMVCDDDFETSKIITGTGSRNSIINNDKTYINGTITGAIEMANEDGDLDEGSLSDFTNGATFVSIANIQNYIPVSECNPEGIGDPSFADTDGDGVSNDDDAYPEDPTRAFNNYYPGENTWGSLAYEDLWPSSGDYDFNDLVLAYRVKEVTNASNNVVELYMYYQVNAIGAGLTNGFGVQFDNITPAQVGNVTGLSIEDGYISLNGNNTEASQAKAVLIPLDNVSSIINKTVPGNGFNTTPGGGAGTSEILEVYVPFVNPLSQAIVGTPPYNPFLIKAQNRGMEIHLPDFVPTSLANPDIFGTFEDASNPNAGIYYVTGDNLPWAIKIAEPFDWMKEKVEIVEGYNHFSEWATSGGSAYPDWYKDYSGYRNDNKIFD